MERNGIERSCGEALDCQTIGYISIHGIYVFIGGIHAVSTHTLTLHTHTAVDTDTACSTAYFTLYVTFVLFLC